jgi:hypothetical protein
VIESPSGRVPEKVPRWDLEETETCGGGKSVLAGSLLVSLFREFIGLELGQTEQAWAHKLPGRAPPGRALVACAPCVDLLALS